MKKSNQLFINFYNDFVIVALTLLLFIVVTAIISMMLNGSKVDGIANGIYWGLSLGLISFYYLRRQFSILITIVQTILNTILTILQFYILDIIFGDLILVYGTFGDFFIAILVPVLLAINKQLLDYLANKINAQKSNKKPIEIN